MKLINAIGGLPKSLQILIKTFLSSPEVVGRSEPAIMEMTDREMAQLGEEEEFVFQLILDRKYERWYLVGVGDYEREVKSDLILPDSAKTRIKRAIICFTEVDDEWIRSKRAEAMKQKMIQENHKEFVEDAQGPRWI